MNVSTALTRDYENDYDFTLRKTNPNKPKSNPISEMLKMKLSSVKTRDYENKQLCALRENKPNSNPKQTQSNPISAPDFLAYRLLTELTEAINTCFWLHKDLLRKSLCQNP